MRPWRLSLWFTLAAVSPAAAQSGNPIVVMETNHGVIKLELFADKAPLTVRNFLQYAEDRFYDGTLFHRVYPSSYIQGGGFAPGLKEKKTRPAIKSEAGNGVRNLRGTIGLVRTGTSQFYINVIDNGSIDQIQPPYTVFGKVIAGMEVVDKIKSVPTTMKDKFQALPAEDVVIQSVRLASSFELRVPKNAVVQQVFTISADVEHPLRGQSLALQLPDGLERVDGKEIQPVAVDAESNSSFVVWRVRGLRPGDYQCTVRSSSGVVQSGTIKITAAK